MMGRERILQALSDALRDAPGDEAELVLMAGRSDLSRAANSVVHQHVSVEDVMVSARVIDGGRTGRAVVHGFTPADMARALADAAELARFAPRDPDWPGLPGPEPVPEVRSHVPETAAVEPAARTAALARVFAEAARDGMTIAGAYATSEKELAVANTRGIAVHAPITAASVNLVAMGDGSSGYASGYSRDVGDLDLDALGRTAMDKCRRARRPMEVEPGEYEVLLEPPAVAELMEWMTYTCFGARSVYEKTSALAGRFGERITGEGITVTDDALDPAGAPVPFDFEGRPKRRLEIIERGVARGCGTDTAWGARLGRPATGHALLPGDEGAEPVPMNLFIASGTVAASSMPARVERGLLVTRFHYVNGFLDTRRALMTGMTRDGTYLVEDGRVRGAVGNLRFTQSILEAFEDLRGISRERQRIPPWWSAADTGALTMPTLHLGKFRFTGRSKAD